MLNSDELRDRLEQALGGSYRLLEELPGGGMSRVFTAEDRSLGRKIVIKVLPPELAATVNVERFKREIQVAAGLQHANIVPVLAAGDVDGLPYLTMPFVAGRSMRQSLSGGKGVPLREVVTVLRDVARALAYAHERGVVHRDIKPDNILWSGGAATVTDFGIAKAITAARTHAVREEMREPLTTAGMSLGTPAYMAPEQVTADPTADHRTDIYSFGITAYELLAGRPPFTGTQQQILTAHLAEKPQPLASRVPGVPRHLADLVMRCLEKDPAARPQTAEAVLDVLSGVPTTGERGAPRRPLSRGAGLAIAAAIVVLIVGVSLWRGTRSEQLVTRSDFVAVVPFRVASADPALQYLREGMIDLLASKLTGEGGLRVVEPRMMLDAWRNAGGSDTRDLSLSQELEVAGGLGAGRLLLGDVVGTPTGLVLSAALMSVPQGDSIARVTVEGPADSLAGLVDQLARQLLANTSGEIPARLAMLGGTSLPALRAYLDGQSRLRRAEVVAAAESFERALSHDSTFALAGLGLSQAVSWFGDQQRGTRGLEVAWRERHRLSPRDQALVEATAGPRFPQISSPQEVYRARERYFQLAQDRADAWYLLGDQIFHYGTVLDIENPLREALRHFTRAGELDSTYVVGYIHGPPLAAALGDTALARRFMRWRAAVDTSTADEWFHRWLLAHAAADTAQVNALWQSPTENLGSYAEIARTALLTGFGSGDALRGTLHLSEVATQQQTGNVAVGIHHWAVTLGRARTAAEYLRLAYPDSGRTTNQNRLIVEVRAANVGIGDEAAARAAASALEQWESPPVSTDSLERLRQRAAVRVMEVYRLLRGDSSHTRRSLARLQAIGPQPFTADSQGFMLELAMIQALHEAVAAPRGAAPRLERFEALLRGIDWGRINLGRASEMTIVAARLHAQRGEFERAAKAVRRRYEWSEGSHPYIVAQLRDEGRYWAQAGRPREAAQAWEHYLRFRADPEPPYAAEAQQIRQALAELPRR